MNDYVKALLRFWWIVVAGVVAAVATAVVVAKSHGASTYSAVDTIMVDSASNPFLRTSVTQLVPQPARAQRVKTSTNGASTSKKGSNSTPSSTPQSTIVDVPQPAQVQVQTPDTQTLVRDANLYPLLIQSDEVAAIREKMFGKLPGTVAAQARYSSATLNRFRTSDFPIIDITATARRPGQAKRLAEGTSKAFQRWLVTSQIKTKVPWRQRILLRTLKTADRATVNTPSRKSLAVVAALAAFAAFLGLALLLHRALPRKQEQAAAKLEREPHSAASHESTI